MTIRRSTFLLIAMALVGGAALAVPLAPKDRGAQAAPRHPAAEAAGSIAVTPASMPFEAPEPPDPPEPPEPPETPDPEDDVFVFIGNRGWLGVQIADVSDEKASELHLGEAHGALVQEVEEDSPAGRAGLAAGDVIVSYQGQRVEGAAALRRMVRETPAGRTAAIGISRDGSAQTLRVKIGERPRFPHAYSWRWEGGPPGGPGAFKELEHLKEFSFPGMKGYFFGGGPRLGVAVDDLTPQLAEYFGVRSGQGVLVKEVMEDTPAAKAGVKAGDVIIRLEKDPIGEISDLHRAVREHEGKKITLTVVRSRAEKDIEVALEAPPEGSRRGPGMREMQRNIRRAEEETRRAGALIEI